MKPWKIIDIEQTNLSKPEFYPPVDTDDFYLASWGGMFAKRLRRKYPELDIEVWKSEPDFNQVTNHLAHGVPCRIFPHRFHLYSAVTWSMLKTLIGLSRNHNLIFFRSTLIDYKFVLITSLLFPRSKILIFHHGSVVPRSRPLKKKLKRRLIELSLHKVTAATYLRNKIKSWLHKVNPDIKLVFLPVGADFNAFYPEDKSVCRAELGLDPNKVYAVYVGYFYRLKGVDVILDLLRKHQDDGFEVLFVGGREGDELMNEVVDSGCHYWHRMGWDLLRKIYSAADFYIHPAFNPDFGGFDVSLMEALACNKPVLSPSLRELDFDYSALGLAPATLAEFEGQFVEMIHIHDSFDSCRAAAMQHLDGENAIIEKLFEFVTSLQY